MPKHGGVTWRRAGADWSALLAGWVLLAAGPASAVAGGDLGDIGTFAKWARVEIVLCGPASRGTGRLNPFAVLVDATFTGPTGRKFKVPGFYDGDGKGGLDGRIWKVRFSADEIGRWSFATSSSNPLLDGRRGSFRIVPAPAKAEGFYRWGRLEYVGTAGNGVRYLKFRDGPYWLKAGCDDPENFLGKFSNYDTPAKRRAAVDILVRYGVNSLYIMTHNIGGDHKDVWPWLGDDARTAMTNARKGNVRFDVARLRQWGELFEYMQRKGVVPYLILEDDSAWTGHDYRRYYREMVARFGHLPALLFNFCEEARERHRLAEALAKMKMLAELDPYNHPRAIHDVNQPLAEYVDCPYVQMTSIQTRGGDPLAHNRLAIRWIRACRRRGRRVLMVGFDEPRPELDRRGWWSAFMGGAVWEAHAKQPYDVPMEHRRETWRQLGGARAFMEALPFWEMQPANELVKSGKAFCLAKPGAAYGLYLPAGGTIEVELTRDGSYDFAWWDPTNGRDGRFLPGGTVSAGLRRFTTPRRRRGDWALRILRRAAPAPR